MSRTKLILHGLAYITGFTVYVCLGLLSVEPADTALRYVHNLGVTLIPGGLLFGVAAILLAMLLPAPSGPVELDRDLPLSNKHRREESGLLINSDTGLPMTGASVDAGGNIFGENSD